MNNAERLNSCIVHNKDFAYNYFSFKTLEELYLMRINGKVVESPQHMLMRVAVGIHRDDIESVIETYKFLSEKYFIFDYPVLLNSGTPSSQLSSNYLITMPEDSLEGIYTCIDQCGTISKTIGNIGVNIQNIRAKGTYIAGTNGVSNGLVPMLRVFNDVAEFHQGNIGIASNVTIYLEPWHSDIVSFLNLKKDTGKYEIRARNLNYALWVPDIFMKRVKTGGNWSLMCPHRCPGLVDAHGEEFEELYEKYENEGKFNKQMPARDLWRTIIMSQLDTGYPHLVFKDACNEKSNQKHLGTIRGAGFNAGIVTYTSQDEIGVCNSASVALNMFVKTDEKIFDFIALKSVIKVMTYSLNRIIDVTFYPFTEVKNSNIKHRPIGITAQGLADTFSLLHMTFEGDEAKILNRQIFETIYYAALEASCELAQTDGPFPSYDGCPVSKGIFQYDMWNVLPTNLWNWSDLKEKISRYGIRNSLLVCVVPTHMGAQILGTSESVEPYFSNISNISLSSGEIQTVNQHLLRDLTERGLWNDSIRQQIIKNSGSVQNIDEVPNDLKEIYKTVWEISNKVTINMAADRGAYIDHSQSLNLYISKPSYGVLTSMYFYVWDKGLKTGVQYIHTNLDASTRRYIYNNRHQMFNFSRI